MPRSTASATPHVSTPPPSSEPITIHPADDPGEVYRHGDDIKLSVEFQPAVLDDIAPPPPPQQPKRRRETRTEETLRYEFTHSERSAKALELAQRIQDQHRIQEDFAAAKLAHKQRDEQLRAQIDQLSLEVTSGYEMRSITCAILYNSPHEGEKTIMRKDTGEVVRTAAMSMFERQDDLEFGA